jgi:hypothetical protein
LTKYDLDEILSMNPLTTFSQSKQSARLDKICQALEEGSKRRRFFITQNGCMGSAPQPAKEGHMICVLYGCSLPVILRKREDQD